MKKSESVDMLLKS